MDKPKILDQQGREHDWDWLTTNFGAITLEPAGSTSGKVFRAVKLQDAEGPAVQLVQIVDQDGNPMPGVGVVRWWPDAPQLPGWGDEVSQWRKRGVFGPTNASGNIGFGMGHGDDYLPPAGGASGVWVADVKGQSDFVSGLGMLGGTDHRHLDVFYRLVDLDVPPDELPNQPPDHLPGEPTDEPPDVPPDQPPADRWVALFEKLDHIIELLESTTG